MVLILLVQKVMTLFGCAARVRRFLSHPWSVLAVFVVYLVMAILILDFVILVKGRARSAVFYVLVVAVNPGIDDSVC